jgi:uncharacterized protein
MSDSALIRRVSRELEIPPGRVEAVVDLLEQACTVPFIARYRKEATGGLDEVAITEIRDRHTRLIELEKRRESILSSIAESEKLTPELEAEIRAAESMPRLEDLYLPYRPKRKTRGSIARERGLGPLAELLVRGETDPGTEAQRFVDPARDIETPEEALAGAGDIVAEELSEEADLRKRLRDLFHSRGEIRTASIKAKETEGAKYRDYFRYAEPVRRVPSHRILAAFRGAEEGYLRLHILPDEETAVETVRAFYSSRRPINRLNGSLLEGIFADAYKRLIAPSLETEMKKHLKKRADDEAIRVFADNLEGLLMAPPLGNKPVLALDPGLRTGCKIACLDTAGNLVHSETIYPLPPHNRIEESAGRVRELVARYDIEAIAVGNGTGGREALAFCEDLGLPDGVVTVSVNESGASVYSASETAREELPDQDVTVRGAVSIGRRLMDPLAELVKIDPKSIGVGQYQHDVDQRRLKTALDDTVVRCVNRVGVNLNTASPALLTYVSGLTAQTARNITDERSGRGGFSRRAELLDVPGIGAKSFEQAAGFLRIPEGKNPLDGSAVHPERYPLVERMAIDLGGTVRDLMTDYEMRKRIDPGRYVDEEVGLPTIEDILAELEKPGRDPRADFVPFRFSEEVHELEDLRGGMVLPGIVTNVTAFGAFVDVGVHQDGLVHISEMAEEFVPDPSAVVAVGQQVEVRVLGTDPARRRISLSLKMGG